MVILGWEAAAWVYVHHGLKPQDDEDYWQTGVVEETGEPWWSTQSKSDLVA